MPIYDILFNYLDQYVALDSDEKQIIRELSLIKEFKKGTLLVEEGKRSNESYFVLKGIVRCYYLIDGVEKTTELYSELDVINPICTIEQRPSENYIECMEDSVILISTPESAQASALKFPKFEMLCRIISEKLAAKKLTDFNSFKTSSPEQRYLKLLENRPGLLQRVPQYHLASFLGITPQSLSRLRKRIVQK